MASVNQGVTPIDPASSVGKVRLLIGDTNADGDNGNGQGEYMWVSDEEIRGYIELQGSVHRAAIFILRLVAMTPAMQYKKWSSADLSVDGAAITSALRALIADIEKSMDADAAAEVADFVGIVPTGASVSQPALLPRRELLFGGEPIDVTLPLGMP